jgi:purine-binding chemotaxis protein CheW
MRVKFGLGRTEKTINTCIVVVEVSLDAENTVIGALVDSVQEVFELEPDQIEPAPKLGNQLDTAFIKGMGKRDERFVIILDIDRVFSSDELAMAGDVGRQEEMQIAGNG